MVPVQSTVCNLGRGRDEWTHGVESPSFDRQRGTLDNERAILDRPLNENTRED